MAVNVPNIQKQYQFINREVDKYFEGIKGYSWTNGQDLLNHIFKRGYWKIYCLVFRIALFKKNNSGLSPIVRSARIMERKLPILLPQHSSQYQAIYDSKYKEHQFCVELLTKHPNFNGKWLYDYHIHNRGTIDRNYKSNIGKNFVIVVSVATALLQTFKEPIADMLAVPVTDFQTTTFQVALPLVAFFGWFVLLEKYIAMKVRAKAEKAVFIDNVLYHLKHVSTYAKAD